MRILSASWLVCANLVLAAAAAAEQGSRREFVSANPKGAIAPGQRTWEEALAKAKTMVANMTNNEKNDIVTGLSEGVLSLLAPKNGCTGSSGALERWKYPGLCLQDGPAGVRGTDLVNAYPAGIHLGATWNRELVRKVGDHMGAEFKRKGIHVALGPVVGPLGRIAKGGRNFEGYGSDPYLAGKLGAEAVIGLQKSVIACIKHFIGNEQETMRNPSVTGMPSLSTIIDDRTMHELYLWPFHDAVYAGVGSVMCSYQRLNGTYACQNDALLNGLLKKELGFKGFVVTDWDAQHAGVPSAEAGLDLVMPDAGFWKEKALAEAVRAQTLSLYKLDEMATRVLGTWLRFGMDAAEWPKHGVGLSPYLTQPHTLVDARDPKSKSVLLQSAVEGHVLVKNDDGVLPLRKPKLLSLFGYDGPAPASNNPSSLPQGVWSLGMTGVGVSDVDLIAIITGLGGKTPEIAANGTLTTGGGSGAGTGSYISSPFNAFENQAYEDGTYLHWEFNSMTPSVNAASDACIVFINEFSMEGVDRVSLQHAASDKLVNTVAASCANTMVVIHNAGIRTMDAWITNPNVTAVILGHLPGQDSGRALVEIMYGRQSPSGRLPYTIAKKAEDYGALLSATQSMGTLDISPTSFFTEGLYIDYRAFMKNNIAPRFPFGWGLTYTTFEYSDLVVKPLSEPFANSTRFNSNSTTTDIFTPIYRVECTVKNTGKVAAAEVAQLYVGIPNAPERQLRGFDKRMIEPGKSVKMEFELARRDLSIWSVLDQQWMLYRGRYQFHVGENVLYTALEKEILI